ncbi:hypothetical protein ACO0LC_02890 [Undibacterium sp. JH2W]|uniref:hypothetical protein n=1 Tax=Undibacterium sp. JH2W TaxID=3413037 RepID=UPI003BF1F926
MRRSRQMLVCLWLTTIIIPSSFSAAEHVSKEAAVAQQAWHEMEKVLLHPRCLNCHAAGEAPTQADDRHTHQFRVLNGHEGKGNSGNLCIACHQSTNQLGSGVPGASHWQHAPASMTWESEPGKVFKSKDLCQILRDPKKNGGRDLPALIEHLRTEPLVLWAWTPGKNAKGEARSTPVISHEEFMRYSVLWAEKGGICPNDALR